MNDALFLHIIAIVVAILIISGFVSKFFQLPIDILNAANGLLLAFLFIFGTVKEVTTHDDGMDQALTVFFMMAQTAIVIMVLIAYWLFRKYKEENDANIWWNILRISLTYSVSLFMASFSCYVISILYIYRDSVFQVQSGKGELGNIIENTWRLSGINLSEFAIILVVIYVFSLVSSCRDNFRLIACAIRNRGSQGEQDEQQKSN